MKKQLFPLLILLFASGLWSCNDQCKETRITRRYTPVSLSLLEIRSSVKVEPSHELIHPGKIYVKGNYLFINEIKEGIHVVDNMNPSDPKFIAFIEIPGNGDISVRNNILYADSYTDLVALNITDPANPKEVSRVENVFRNGQFDGASWYLNQNSGVDNLMIQDYTIDYVTETVTTNCEENMLTGWYNDMLYASSATINSSGSGASSASSAGSNGQAGSMSRFALYDHYLYTVGQSNLHLFDITNASKPVDFATVNIGWNIETIFPYKNKLFLGSTTGMFIYDNSDPSAPKQLANFEHGRACDPVVVHDDIAYVTLRTGNMCAGTQNQLDLVDVSNASSPKLIKSYQMENPHGLSIDFPTLYLCEGDKGLKVFDVTDKNSVDQHLLSFNKDFHAYDVISLDKTLMLIGDDGFYQFDVSDPKNLRQLSKIPVKKVLQ
jgi:hypothetical protein